MNLHDEALAARSLLAALASVQSEMTDDDAEIAIASETSLVEAIEAALVACAEDAAHIEAINALVDRCADRSGRARVMTKSPKWREECLAANPELRALVS